MTKIANAWGAAPAERYGALLGPFRPIFALTFHLAGDFAANRSRSPALAAAPKAEKASA